MGDLGLPGSVVEMADDAPQKNLWEVRKAGLNIMMSLKGDGKPVSFIEDCAVPLEHLAEYTDALTEVFARHGTRGTWYAHASVGTLHVRPILDMRRDGAAQDARHRRGGVGAGAQVQGRLQRRARRRAVPRRMDRWQFGPAINEAFRAIKRELDPGGLFNPGKIVDPPRMDDGALFRFPPPERAAPYRRIALEPVLDWSAWNVQNDPVTEADVGARHRRRHHRRLRQGRRDVQQQRPLPQVRRRHHVPELPRHPRRAAPDARPRQHAAAGAVGPARPRRLHQRGDARHDGPVRVAARAASANARPASTWRKMKIEFLAHYKAKHGHTLKDRLVAHLPDYAHAREPRAVAGRTCATACPARPG